jgi:pimeloyl-ACP methyl ester carboxylesterase
MSVDIDSQPRPARRGRVIALHCSGGGAGQWDALGEALGDGYEVVAPEHYGCASTGHWTGEHAFTLADEAARAIALVDGSAGKVHLVGHSYGGGVALGVALARPDRIAGMALYEPSAFHLLRQMGEPGIEAYAEIASVARSIGRGILIGDYRGSVAAFVDYWNGPGAWDALRPSVQGALIRWAPKGPLDFRALIHDPTRADAYRGLAFPVLILRGEHAPAPTRLIAGHLALLLPSSRLAVVDGAGHMGPLTHASKVSELIAGHIGAVDGAAPQPQPWGPRTLADVLAAAARPGGGGP